LSTNNETQSNTHKINSCSGDLKKDYSYLGEENAQNQILSFIHLNGIDKYFIEEVYVMVSIANTNEKLFHEKINCKINSKEFTSQEVEILNKYENKDGTQIKQFVKIKIDELIYHWLSEKPTNCGFTLYGESDKSISVISCELILAYSKNIIIPDYCRPFFEKVFYMLGINKPVS